MMGLWDGNGWLPAKEAREFLGITRYRLHRLWKQGKVRRTEEPVWTGFIPFYWYSREDLRALLKRSKRQRKRAGRWLAECDLANETEWLSTKEAADWLNVHVTRVWQLVKRGVLGCRREEHGKSVRLWLSRREVEMYLADGERKECVERYRKFRRDKAAVVQELSAEQRQTLENAEFLTVAGAAQYLGISPMTLYGYRASGRVPAKLLRLDSKKKKQYVFRREDLDALLADPQYQAYRERWRKAFQEEAVAERIDVRLGQTLEWMRVVNRLDDPNYEPRYAIAPDLW